MHESFSEVEDTGPQTAEPRSRSRRLMRGAGVLLIILSVLLGWFLIITYLAWQNGQSLLVERQQAELSAQLARQVELAQEDIAQQRFTLAVNRLEWVLQRSPDYPEARSLWEQAQAELNDHLTPQSAGVTAVPTTTPLPTPTPGLITDPAKELARVRQLMQNDEWEQAASGLVAFQLQFPDYERQNTDQLLYEAYIHHGISLLDGEKVELGLYYLSQAEKLGDLPQEAVDYRAWAELYLQGIAFYGVNWEASVYYFRDLCLAAPFYQLACERLYDGLIGNGDQYAFAQNWCPAQTLYQEAIQYGRTPALVDKLNQAANGCLSATPTSSAPITDTVPITETLP